MKTTTYNDILKMILSNMNANKILDHIENNTSKNDDGQDFMEQLVGFMNVYPDDTKFGIIINKDSSLQITHQNDNSKSLLLNIN